MDPKQVPAELRRRPWITEGAVYCLCTRCIVTGWWAAWVGISHAIGSVTAVATRAHAEQLDKAGQPYILHLSRVASAVAHYGYLYWATAMLHDILEDTPIPAPRLAKEGIPANVIDAVQAVTRRPSEVYADFITRAAAHPIGRIVKLADVRDNLGRLDTLSDKTQAEGLRQRYERATRILEASVLTSEQEGTDG